MPGLITKLLVKDGDLVNKGQELLVVEAMKMENAITAPEAAIIKTIKVSEGQVINKGDVYLEYSAASADDIVEESQSIGQSKSKDRLEELRNRKTYLYDEVRVEAVAKRRKKGKNTARENIELLIDEDTFREYGSLIVAAQRSRRTEEDLIANTPADGLISGQGHINGDLFDENISCLAMAYDYTVLAGTQGTMNHQKMDRVIAVAKENKLPVILFAEGGGGRPGDVDMHTIAGLFITTFVEYAGLQGVVPTIAIVSGYCFAGNAALAGSSDVIIATKDISLGMGGPAMIEGGGLGKFHPRDVGPAAVQVANGVVDILVEDETEAIEAAKKYLGYWQGKLENYEAEDQKILQDIIPSNRKRTFDIRRVIEVICDTGSILELKPECGKGMITCFARIEGCSVGIIANNSVSDAGAITSENALKASSFLNKCNSYNIPVVSFVDTPGIMVGPEAEKSGTVRSAGDLFVAGAKFTPPLMTVVLRRAYGLGAMAMMGGSTRKPQFTLSWPTGEFGAMGLEGAVELGYRKELEAISDPKEREQYYNKMVDEAYERGKALSMATMYEIDDVIEPKDTRSWIARSLQDYKRH